MNRTQIEAWALDIVDRVQSGRPIEDSLVELKSDWIEAPKAARRIAGHANAARGESILWLIGIDAANGVVGAKHEELANWYPQVQKQFDGIAPPLIDLNVPVPGNTIVALYFETDRAPFVVKNPQGGLVQFEVPWRDTTRVRTATRADLIRLLVPQQRLPGVEVLDGELLLDLRGQPPDPQELFCHLQVTIYIEPRTRDLICFPFHRCTASFELPGVDRIF